MQRLGQILVSQLPVTTQAIRSASDLLRRVLIFTRACDRDSKQPTWQLQPPGPAGMMILQGKTSSANRVTII
jgi:hypothetical protein